MDEFQATLTDVDHGVGGQTSVRDDFLPHVTSLPLISLTATSGTCRSADVLYGTAQARMPAQTCPHASTVWQPG